MLFKKPSPLPAAHAFLSPSNYHWMNYTPEKMLNAYRTAQAVKRGVDYHDFAHKAILLGEELKDVQKTVNLYVRDSIHYGMRSEFPLYYSDHCFGTADSIGFERDCFLRIHDLKTGITPTSMKQLYGYAAIFCLQYKKNPFRFDSEFRIYQHDEIRVEMGDPVEIERIMNVIVQFCDILDMENEATNLEVLA